MRRCVLSQAPLHSHTDLASGWLFTLTLVINYFTAAIPCQADARRAVKGQIQRINYITEPASRHQLSASIHPVQHNSSGLPENVRDCSAPRHAPCLARPRDARHRPAGPHARWRRLVFIVETVRPAGSL